MRLAKQDRPLRVGVVLAGCGFRDGSEIHESVLALLAIARGGAEAVCFAPDRPQSVVIDHYRGTPMQEVRNVLVESARIARGAIRDVAEARVEDLDALVLPGGYGAALNLCDFATRGSEAEVDPGVERLVRAMHAAGKPIGAICIAPALVARVLGETAVTVTIGNDPATAEAIGACGAQHEPCPVGAFVVDAEQRVATTPAYMLGPTIADVAEGIDGCIGEVLRLAREPARAAR